jgi:hypothetical protein
MPDGASDRLRLAPAHQSSPEQFHSEELVMKIFLASSRESLNDMHRVAQIVEGLGHVPLPWDSPTAFLPGTYTLNGLIEISRDVDAAVFVFAEDDTIWYRTSELHQARDNVLLEYGLFAGILGPERALICRKGQPKTPSDLEGIIHIDISRVESARASIENWIRRLDHQRGAYSHPLLARDFIRIVANDRKALDRDYRERKFSAHTIDIVSIALSNALDELATDSENRLLRRVLFNDVHVRLMFVAPTSQCVRQRALEDGDSFDQLQALLRRSVRRSVEVYQRLKALHEEAETEGRLRGVAVGLFEIRVTEFCPHFTIYRTDDSILLGIYTAGAKGLDSAVLQVQKSHDAMFQQVAGHFNSLWALINRPDTAAEEKYLVKCHSLMQPSLNEALVKELLGEGDTGS